jgi:hypothetical protein
MFAAGPIARCVAQAHSDNAASTAPSASAGDEKGEKDEKEDEDKDKGGKKHDADDEKDEEREHAEKKESEEIEQPVQLSMVPAAVIDAVNKEVPGGTITEAELEAEKGKIMWGFDVKSGDAAYDVNITVDGKFYSKKVDDEKDEKDQKAEKSEKDEKKSEAGEKD